MRSTVAHFAHVYDVEGVDAHGLLNVEVELSRYPIIRPDGDVDVGVRAMVTPRT